MKLNTTLLTAVFGIALAVSPALAQEEGNQDVTVQALGSFVTTTTKNGVQQSATDSGGVLATYRYFFDRHNGAEVNYAYANNTQNYGPGGSLAGIATYSHEFSAAYVLRFPMKRITPFVLAGAGGLVFDPQNFAAGSTQARAAFVYGAGADINLARHVFLRAGYRGLVYDSPTYGIPVLAGLDRVTHRAEPTIGFGYRF